MVIVLVLAVVLTETVSEAVLAFLDIVIDKSAEN